MKKVPPFFKDMVAFVENAPLPCFSVDRSGTVLSVNAAGARLVGCAASALTGRSIEDFFFPSDSLLKKLRSRRPLSAAPETAVSLSGGSEPAIPVRVRLQRVRPDRGKMLFFAWIHDDRDLEELRNRLEHTEKLSAMAIVAGKVAHEIRTPLNSIFLNNDLLQERVEKMRSTQSQKLRRYIGILQEEVERLNEVVRSYLSLAQLAGSDREATELQTFLEEFIEEVREEYAGRQISIATAFRARERRLPINQRQFRRVMLNLFVNSRDAMKKGGVITVSTAESGGGYRITVSDNGEGIPPDSLHDLTAPFTSLKANGSGLGLYLTREIVEHHGGRLDIQSIRGEGTSVIITLPTARRRQVAVQ